MLCDIALGPTDWTTTAALVAMYAWSQEDKVIAMTLEQTLLELFDKTKQWEWCCYGGCMLSLAKKIPTFPEDTLSEMTAWYHAFFEEE